MNRVLLFLFVLMLWTGFVECQELTVQANPQTKTVLTRADIEALPHVTVAADKSAEPVSYEGVALRSVLEKAGVQFGESLRGKRMASYLLVEADDNCRVVIALPEIDPAFSDKQILLAFLRNGKPLDDKEGPYRIVIPDEKRMARWVRQVKDLKIQEAP